jgi:hypothetical protein
MIVANLIGVLAAYASTVAPIAMTAESAGTDRG